MNRIKSIVTNNPLVAGLFYMIFGLIWIFFSEQLIQLIPDVSQMQVLSDFVFISAGAFILFIVVRNKRHLSEEMDSLLKKSLERFEATFEQDAVGIIHLNPNEKFIRVNQKMCDMLGYKKSELLNLKFERFIHPDDLETGRLMDQQLIENNRKSYSTEKRYIRKDGQYVHGVITKSAVHHEDGSLNYLIAVIEEITGRKETEIKLTRSLHEKEILLSEIHHRVKNNLALISALFELQSTNTDNIQAQKILDASRIRIKCLAMIYESFDEFDERAEMDFGNYLSQLVDFINRMFNPDKVDIVLEKDIHYVRLNINQAIPAGLICNEILVNAYTHAFKPGLAGQIKVSLRESGEMIRLSISDDGIGIPEHIDLQDPETLGLTMVKYLTSQLKGRVTISKDPGSRFDLTFRKNNINGPGSTLHRRKVLKKVPL